jgi:hypothetical protein
VTPPGPLSFSGPGHRAGCRAPDWPRLGGLIALSSFPDSLVSLDLGAGKVHVSSASLPIDGSSPMKLVRQASGFAVGAMVPVEVGDRTLWLELDSGSSEPLLLAPHAARALGVPVAESAEAGGAAPKPAPPTEVSIALPGVGPVRVPARVQEMIYDGNIGAPLITRYRWHLDLANARIKIEPPGPES